MNTALYTGYTQVICITAEAEREEMRIAVGEQDDLNQFIKGIESMRLTLGESILVDILKQMIKEDCQITASKTDHEAGKMWIEVTWE